MASTTLGTFCCVTAAGGHRDIQTVLNLNSEYYNAVCIVTALVGMIGVVYQFLPNFESRDDRRTPLSNGRQKRILCWLAVADLFAIIGIFIRSVAWLADKTIISGRPLTGASGHWFCGIIFAWIHYFYAATYFWTLCYAFDVYRTTKQKLGYLKVYHVVSWGTPLVLTLSAVMSLYLPHFRCHTEYPRAIASYLLTYVPILLVMILNPVLYILSSKEVKILLTSYSGQFSDHERHILRDLKEKYFLIVLVFFICWLPNILNGIILWSMWEDLPRDVILTIWYIMATVNPLQALLNFLVYHGWSFRIGTFTSFCRTLVMPPVPGQVDLTAADNAIQEDRRQLIYD